MRTLSKVFYVLAFLLFGAMCAVVAYNYCDMTWGIKYAGYSAPAWTAFMTAIPFAIAIATCIGIALAFKKKVNYLYIKRLRYVLEPFMD